MRNCRSLLILLSTRLTICWSFTCQLESALPKKAHGFPVFTRAIIQPTPLRSGPLPLFSSPVDESEGADSAAATEDIALLESRRQELLAATRDPFAMIRTAIWALLLLGSLAGLVASITGKSSNVGFGQNLQNILVNAAFVVAMGGALFFESKLGDQSKEVVKEELENPMLKGGSGFFLDNKRKN